MAKSLITKNLMKRSNIEYIDLPWQAEIPFAFLGLVFMTLPRLLFILLESSMNNIQISPGIPIDLHQALGPTIPLIWILGLIFGWNVRCLTRNWVLHKLSQI